MNEGIARRAWLKILYNTKDISNDITPHLKSFSFNDVMSGEADDINITLEDREELWQGDWLPEKGDTLKVSIMTLNWRAATEGEKELPLGLFEIDEVEISKPPSEVKIKAVSVPDNTELRGTDKSRRWENTTLKVIAQDIADGAKMELFYDGDDPSIDRAEQSQQSDLSFLSKLLKDHGLALKVSDNKLVVFDEHDYEEADPVKTIRKPDLASFSLKSSTREIYRGCHVKYQKSDDDEIIEYIFVPDEEKKGKMLEVNEEVDSVEAAEKLAKKKLREKNCSEVTVSLHLMGDFDLLAGNTVTLEGFHSFDGKYIITKGSHDIGAGYKMGVDLRRCLDGY